jgi:protein TonB
MFEQVLVTTTGRTVRPCAVLISFVGEMALVGLGILLPLLYTDTLPRVSWAGRILALQPPSGKPAPELRPRTEGVPRLVTRSGGLIQPRGYPDKPILLIDPVALSQAEPGVPYGLGSGEGPSSPAMLDALRPPAAPPPPPVRVEKPIVLQAPLRVGGVVKAPAAVRTPRPAYPPLARQARVSGLVQLEAIIATDGTVRNIRLVQGHPLLTAAAIAAVKEWVYTPPLLNGEPVEVIMQVDVTFRLGQ